MIQIKNKKEIWIDMIQEAFELSLLNEKETFQKAVESEQPLENVMVLIFSVISTALEKIYQNEKKYIESVDLDFAENESLNNLGKLIGIDRKMGTKCYVDVVFTLEQPNSENKSIPSSVFFTSTTNKIYELSEDVLIPAGSLEVHAPAYSKNIGTSDMIQANSLIYSSEDLSVYTGTSTKINNPQMSTAGSYVEDDEDYREELLNAFLNHELGSELSLNMFFSNIDGIEDYKIIPQWDGAGGMKIIVKPGNDKFIEEVESKINETFFYNDGLIIRSPIEKIIDLSMTININLNTLTQFNEEQKENFKNKVQEAVKIFFNGGFRKNNFYHKGMKIGEDFIPFQLSKFLSQEFDEIQDIKIEPENRIINDNDLIFNYGNINIKII